MSSDVLADAPEGNSTPAPGTAESAADEMLSQGLHAIAGLDAARGLKHLRGRVDSYVRLLRKFAETRPADIESMSVHLAARDYVKLSEVAHNVKGVAGFLGASDIHALATEVSAAVRAGRGDVEVGRLVAALIDAQSELRAGVLALIDPLPRSDE